MPLLLNMLPFTTDLPIEVPHGKGCACWPGIARQIVLGLFPLRLKPQIEDAADRLGARHRRPLLRGPGVDGFDLICLESDANEGTGDRGSLSHWFGYRSEERRVG